MSAAAAAPERRPRLNPFAFPSDTAFRFGLLVAAVVGANLYVWQWIASNVPERGRARRRRLRLPAPARPPRRRAIEELIAAARDAFSRLRLAALPLPGLVDARRHGRAAPRRRGDHGRDARSGSRGAASCAGDRRGRAGRGRRGSRSSRASRGSIRPALLESARRIGGRPCLRASGSVQRRRSAAGSSSSRRSTRRRSGPSSGTSSAHIRNRDVGITYFTLSVWYAFMLVAVVPFLVTLLDESELSVERHRGGWPCSRSSST